MIAIWMAYSLIIGALVAAIAWLLENIARSRGLPTRGIWIGAMAMTLAISATAAIPAAPARVTFDPTPSGVPGVSRTGGRLVTVVPDAPALGLAATVRLRAQRMGAAINVRLTSATVRLSPLNDVLAATWIALTLVLAGIVIHAVVGGRRLKRGLTAREIEGTPVLLTESIGPAAIGIGDRAILLPAWAAGLEPALLRLIVRHEREHLFARDPAVLLAGLVAVVLMPWHVALWWNWRRLRLAVEVDCDARVLRAHPDVQMYGRVLLLTCQRAMRAPWTSLPLFTVVAPLQPRASQLAQRIAIMTSRGTVRSGFATLGLVAGIGVAGAIVLTVPVPRLSPRAQASAVAVPSARYTDWKSNVAPAPLRLPRVDATQRVRVTRDDEPRVIAGTVVSPAPVMVKDTEPDDPRFAIVHATQLGLYDVPSDFERNEIVGEILIYADGPARISTGLDSLVPLTDTLHLKRLPRINADVTESNVYIQLVGPGSIWLGVTGGDGRSRFGAGGPRIKLVKGGMEIQSGPNRPWH